MTVEVQIANKDKDRTVEVRTRDYKRGDNSVFVETEHHTKIAPGESRTFYVHLLRELSVSEQKPT